MVLDVILRDLSLSLRAGSAEVQITDVTDDSRRVTPGCLFVARDTGDVWWRDYAAQAVAQGAAAVVAPGEIEVPAGVVLAVHPCVDQRLAGALAANFFGHPAKQLKLLGVTGTNGKTTVATLIQHLLNAAPGNSDIPGTRCGFIGTTAIDTGHPDGPTPAELTTPGAIELQRLFAEMVAHGCTACAMEVSSHALDQGRVDGLHFAAAVFTNLTQDHLDYHGTMENYAAAKAKLFRKVGPGGRAVLPREDSAARAMLPELASMTTLVWTSADPTIVWGPDYVITPERLTAQSSAIRFLGGNRPTIQAVVPLVGEHNLRNLVQAIAAADAVAPLPEDRLTEVLESLPGVPGRLEPVVPPGADSKGSPAVLVDYAHTPDALRNVIAALRPVTEGRLIVVFGCGGDRDRTKRPLMARAATEHSDLAYLTSDNPRTEDPQQILDDAYAGVVPEKRDTVVVEVDRAEAIRAAVLAAQPNDTVLVAGKGHEDYQVLGNEKIHFDDREHAEAALQVWVEQHGSTST